MSISVAHPVQTLRAHSSAFEAALSVCLADPRVRAVHKLRTESRRLEAQIALLKAMKGLPPFRKEATKALWQIKKLRQSAGLVRDLDVQTGHLQDHAKALRSGKLPEEEKQRSLDELDTMLKKREELREKFAAELVSEITKRQVKAAESLEKLNSALKDAERHSLASTALLTIAQRQFESSRVLTMKRPSADDLHTLRKAAKQARYLAENAGAKSAAASAKRYENVQELGGAWHDWLDLTAAARKELGKKHTTATEFMNLRDNNLQRFRAELAKFAPPSKTQAERGKKEKKKKS